MYQIIAAVKSLNFSHKEFFGLAAAAIYIFIALPIYALYLNDIILYFGLENEKAKSFPIIVFYWFYGFPLAISAFCSSFLLITSLDRLPGLRHIGEGWRSIFSIAIAPFVLIFTMTLSEDFIYTYLRSFFGYFSSFSRESIVSFGAVITLNIFSILSVAAFLLKLIQSSPDRYQ